MINRFRVVARLDLSRPQEGTVEIDRGSGTLSVRPYRRRRVYTLPLATVAEIVVSRIIKAEVAEKRAARKSRRRGGRGQ